MLQDELEKVGWADRSDKYHKHITMTWMPKKRKTPVCSVVVISYRTHPNTETCLFQLKRFKDIEIIFVNNGGKSDYYFNHPLIDKYIQTKSDKGAYMARNIGALFSDSYYLMFVDDDGIPCNDFVKQHLRAFKEYDIVSSTGCCMPLTGNPWNYNAYHYRVGSRPCPYFPNLEGNCCFDSTMFFSAGGWDDDLKFGGGGLDICNRMLQYEPDKRKYMYMPDAILYHDYTQDLKTLEAKKIKQYAGVRRNLEKDKNYYYHRDVFIGLLGKERLLIKR